MKVDRSAFLSTFPVVEEPDYLRHMSAFVASFVVARKRERWLYLLTQRPKKIGRDSPKLHSDLDRRTCRRFENHPELQKIVPPGVFFEFGDTARWIDAATALSFPYSDSILSIVPGRLAIFFFHECETWLCESK